MCGRGRRRLGESALDRARGVEEVTDWERAHLRVEGNGGERHRLGESVLDRVGMSGRERCQLRESALDRVGMSGGG